MLYIYTDNSNITIFYTVLESAERNMLVMQAKYLVYYCKFGYFN